MPVCLVTAGSPVAGGCHQRVEMTTFGTFSQSKSMTKIRKLTPSGLGGSRLTTASSRGTTRAIPASLRSLVVAVFLVLASPPTLHGAFVNGIDVISQSYQISASWTEKSFVAPFFTSGGYSLSSSDGTPLAASTTSADDLQTANASIDQFSLHNHGSILPFVADFLAPAFSCSAQGAWDFRPADALLDLNLAISVQYNSDTTGIGFLTVELTDMTTSTTLLDLVNPTDGQGGGYETGRPWNESINYTFGVNPNDVYEFSIYAYGEGDYGDETSEGVAASIASVPDGGLTLGMLGVAMGGLAFIRRRFQS